MTAMNELIVFESAQIVAGVVWTYTVACRIMRMDHLTRPRIKWGMAFFGAGGLFFAVAPLMPPSYAALFNALAGTSAFCMQWATSSLWSSGVPSQFQREEKHHAKHRP